MKLPKFVIELHRFVSKDETRIAMRNVYVEYLAGDSMATAVATDGHRLVYLQFDMGESQPLDGGFYLEGKVLKNIKLGKDGTAEYVNAEVLATVKGATTIHSFKDMPSISDVEFPQWRTALPTPLDGNTACNLVGINSRYIADFADYLKACGPEQGIGLEVGASSTDAIGLTAHAYIDDDAEKSAIRCIIMPMRL